MDEAAWNAKVDDWLPTVEEKAYVKSLMVPCHEQGKIASWIAPPARGIDGHEFEYEYVKL